jgi:hypothetical protein
MSLNLVKSLMCVLSQVNIPIKKFRESHHNALHFKSHNDASLVTAEIIKARGNVKKTELFES